MVALDSSGALAYRGDKFAFSELRSSKSGVLKGLRQINELIQIIRSDLAGL